MPSLVMLLRHAEKPLSDGPPRGVTVDGTPDRESLTPRGWQRAGALVGLFAPGGNGRSAGVLPTPTHLFASQIVGNGSERPRETLLPLSEQLGLPVDSRFKKTEIDGLVGAIRAIEGVVLVAWEHHLIPSIATELVGDASKVPQVWPDDRYDVVWVFDTSRPGQTEFREVPEMLLAGDNPKPIGANDAPARPA